MHKNWFALSAVCWVAAAGLAVGETIIKSPSPNRQFALRITESDKGDAENPKADLIKKGSSEVMVELGTVNPRYLAETTLVWSADSKWVAYGTRNIKEGETRVFFWTGSAFEEVSLPDKLPLPKITFRKEAKGGGVKNYGSAVTPVRWLKTGGLELSTEWVLLSRVDDRTYIGNVEFTISFDADHRASVSRIGKSKTVVER